MTDVDTQETPPEGSEIKEPTSLDAVKELIQANNEEIMNRMQQSTQTWLGRRDKELIDTFTEQINSLKPKKTPEEQQSEFYDDPEKAMEQFMARKQNERIAFAKSIESKIISKMNSNYVENGQKTEAGEVVAKNVVELFKNFDIDQHKDLSPERAADLIISKAEASAFKEISKQPRTAFDGREPTDKKLGSSDGKKAGTKETSHVNIESDRARRLAEKWGYKEDDLAKLFGQSKE